jgi:adenylate cyclase
VRCYQVIDLYDDLVEEGSVIREEAEGFRLLVDLKSTLKAEAIARLEAALKRLRQ